MNNNAMKNAVARFAVGCALAPALFLNPAAAAENWAGSMRCEIGVSAAGYSHQETQTWTISGAAPTKQGAFMVYPASWSVTGQGTHDRSRNSNRRVAKWAAGVPGSNSPVSAPIAFHVTPAGRLVVQLWHSQLSAPGGYTGTDQYINDGVPQPEGRLVATVYEWQPRKIEVAPTDTQIAGSHTTEAKAQLGPLQPPDAQATVSCTWSFGQGSAPALPPGNTMPPSSPAGTTPPTTTPPTTTAPTNSSTKLLSVSPQTMEQGAIGTGLTLTGQGTHWLQAKPTIVVTPDIGLPVTNVQATSDGQLLAQLDVQYSAAPGPRTITVTMGSEVVSLPNAFTVTPRARPELVSVTPNRAKQGEQNLTVQLTGKNTRWVQGTTRVQIARPVDASQSGVPAPSPGVTVLSTTVHSPISASAVFNVDANAAVGSYWFSVYDAAPSDWLKIVDGFTVEAAAPILTATPLDPSLLPTPALCTLRGPELGPSLVTPGSAHLDWNPIAGAKGYTVSRSDLGVLTSQPLASADTSYVHYALLPHPGTYVYTITAKYPGGCGATTISLNSQVPMTPDVYARNESQAGRVTLTWYWPVRTSYAQVSGDYTGLLITGPALPPAGREVLRERRDGDHTYIDGVPAGSRTWTVKAYWDRPGGRLIDNTGKTITVMVP